MRWPLHVYLGLLVLLFAAVAGVAATVTWSQARSDARAAALDDADFAARTAAAELSGGVQYLSSFVASTAASPAASALFDRPEDCSLAFSLAGALSGHIAALDDDGRVVCSSLPGGTIEAHEGYGNSSWFREARAGLATAGPVTDPLTGRATAVWAAPIGERGVFAAVIDLEPVGTSLAERYGGARGLEFVVVEEESGTVVGRSVAPAESVGLSLLRADSSASDLPARDLEGNRRLYRKAHVEGVGWTVFAGAESAQALAGSDRLIRRQLAVIGSGSAVFLVAITGLYVLVTRPIKQLSAAAEEVAAGSRSTSVRVGGPAEVAALGTNFNRLSDAVNEELAERRKAEDEARASARNYRVLFDHNPQPMWVLDLASGEVLEVNEAAIARYGYSRDEFLQLNHLVIWADPVEAEQSMGLLEAGGVTRIGPVVHITKDGLELQVLVSGHGTGFADRAACLVIAEDITEKERLESQLRQAQRLESVGQLAGGVAHDFNNLLSVILNYSAFVRADLAAADAEEGSERWQAAQRDLTEVEEASHRAARLTRQLLTFARQEVIRPEVLDLNQVVLQLQPLLERTLGAHITMAAALTENLWPVEADAGQLEQVLVNLAVNARDAMAAGGTLAIDTGNVDVDEAYASTYPGLAPGPYARLRVSDTGSGMPPGVIERAFEPFFTTKGEMGTGLGLATVYGIVKQAGGQIRIYSEVGHGTTITVLLPRAEGAPAAAVDVPTVGVLQGNETVLLLEDEEPLLEVAARILERGGYTVLKATNGEEALQVETAHSGRIDLLISDVVMPGMLGQEAARRLHASRPELKVLFTSGYANSVTGVSAMVEEGAALLEKPFSAQSLLSAVRQLLDNGETAGALHLRG
ncbi:MAG: ATP-binding protein [Dehalococcoidia bacterium]